MMRDPSRLMGGSLGLRWAGGALPSWWKACQLALAERGVQLTTVGAGGPSGPPLPDVWLALDPEDAQDALRAQPPVPVWYLTDGAGAPLHGRWPLLAPITLGQGIELKLWCLTQSGPSAGHLLRRLHVGAEPLYGRGIHRLGPSLAALLSQAWRDCELGVHPVPADPSSLAMLPGTNQAAEAPSPLRMRVQGAWRAWMQRQLARYLTEHWRIGVVNAPMATWLNPSFVPQVQWITPPDAHRYHADPCGLTGSDRLIFCEQFDDETGTGRLVRVELDDQGRVCSTQVVPIEESRHVSFPHLLRDGDRVLGTVESIASRRCVLYEVDAQGQWRPLSTLLEGVAAADPCLFSWEGRHWLAYTDADLGEHDNLCLRYADRLEGPWYSHANNPVKRDVRGSRMAGGFFDHAGALYRPGQDCLGTYGAAVVIHRIVRCTPTEFEEVPVRRVTPDAQGPCPDGLHTLNAWGARTLVDGKRWTFSGPALLRKIRRRLGLLGLRARATAKPQAGAPVLERVAVVVPHLRMGGGELSMLRIAAGLARQGVQVELIVNTLRTSELAVPGGISVTSLGCEGTLQAARALALALRRSAPQVVLSAFPHTNVATVLALRWAGVGGRCVVTEHAPLSLQIQREGGWRYRVLPPLVRWAYRRADAVVAVSSGVAADLQAMLGVDQPVSVMTNPVIDDTQRLDPLDDPGHPWLLDPALDVIMSVSRLSVEKDIPTLMCAFAQVHALRPSTRLLLLGEGPDRARLEALRAELGLTEAVQLPGRVEQPRRWMQHASVFALASTYEGFGNVLIEALSCGVPVVSTDCPVGPRDILANGRFGVLVPVGDSQALAQALVQMLDQPQAWPGACEHALGFTESASSLAYHRLFTSLL